MRRRRIIEQSQWNHYRPERVCQVIREAARFAGITPNTLLTRSNERQPVAARRYAAVRLRGMNFSYPQIGRWLGGRHHSTIMYYIETATPQERTVIDGQDESGVWAI